MQEVCIITSRYKAFVRENHIDECDAKIPPAYILEKNTNRSKSWPWYFQDYPVWLQYVLLSLDTVIFATAFDKSHRPGNLAILVHLLISFFSYFVSSQTQSLLQLEYKPHYTALAGTLVVGTLSSIVDCFYGEQCGAVGQQVFKTMVPLNILSRMGSLSICLASMESANGCNKITCGIRSE